MACDFVAIVYFLFCGLLFFFSSAERCGGVDVSSQDVREAFSILKRSTQGCPKPTDPENGKVEVEFDTFRVGDAIKYKCNAGFTMMGSATRHCQENGRWAGERPICEKLCSFPIIHNMEGLTFNENPGQKDGLRDTSGNIVLSEVEFICAPNFIMNGSARIRCLSGGSWDHAPPVCVKSGLTQCIEPGIVQNGVKQPEASKEYPSGSIVYFKCNTGYVLSGAPLIVCTEGGTWSSGVPSCLSSDDILTTPKVPWSSTLITLPTTELQANAVQCVEPPVLAHGKYSITFPSANSKRHDASLFEINTSIEYECFHPYVLVGVAQRYCLASSEWSGIQPVCKPDCGKGVEPKSPQVIGGSIAVQHGYPWQVALTTYISRAEFRFIHCGGVVIHERWVLTAAHCLTKQLSTELLNANTFLLLFGKHYVDRNIDDNNVISRKVLQFYIHPRYNPWSIDNDLGLVHLKDAVTFNEAIAPLCLPKVNSMITFQEGQLGVVSGWGYTSHNKSEAKVLMIVELPIVDSKKCQESYKKYNFQATVTENMFCAGFDSGGKNTCQGDSGGAMAFYEDDHYVLEGIVSWGNQDDCAAQGSYGGFVRVRNFVPWINIYVPH